MDAMSTTSDGWPERQISEDEVSRFTAGSAIIRSKTVGSGDAVTGLAFETASSQKRGLTFNA